MEAIHELQPVIVLLFVGIIAVTLTRPFNMSPIIGYLLSGILIGPYGLELIEESKTIHLLAELGVVFLLFDIGLHFSLEHIWDARREILGLGPIQVLFCTGALTGIAMAFGYDPFLAFIIGAGLALSSTAVVAQILAGYRQSNCPVGSGAMAVLIFQDICAIFLLIFADSFGEEGASLFSTMGTAALKALAAFLVTIVLGRYLATPIFRGIANLKNEEIFTATALLIVLVTAAATGLLELSLTLGAFLGGMMIAETPYRHFIQTEVKPFRGLLLSFFFITIGMSLNTSTVLKDWWQILIIVTLMIGIKALFIYLAARTLRSSNRLSIQLGFLLSQGSEFAFVVFSLPHVSQSLGVEFSSILISAVALSMALAAPIANWGYRLAEKLEEKKLKTSPIKKGSAETHEKQLVIIGLGEVGRCVADGLEAHGISYQAVEIDHDRFLQATRDGYTVVFGDATDLRLMETIEIANASTLVITGLSYEVVRDVATIARSRYPDLHRFIPIEKEIDRPQFESLGINAIIDRSFPKGLDITAAVLRTYNIEEHTIHQWMKRQQSRALTQRDEIPGFSNTFPGEKFSNQEG